MFRCFSLVVCIAFLALKAPGQGSTVDIQGWDLWQTFTLATATISTIAEELSSPFFSHFSGRTIADLVRPPIKTTLRELKNIFISHHEAVSKITLIPAPVFTPALAVQSVFVSHYDAAGLWRLEIPQLIR